jgi:hypothetical protein
VHRGKAEDLAVRLTLATPLASLTGRVQLADGSPAAGCTVAFHDIWYGPLAGSVTTQADGGFAFLGVAPHQAEIVITPSSALRAQGYGTVRRPGLMSAIQYPIETPPHIVITLEASAGTGVRWQIASASAAELAVRIRPVAFDSVNDFRAAASAEPAFDGTTFQLDVAPGVWRMAFAIPGEPPWVSHQFTVDAESRTDLGTLAPPLEAVLAIDMRDKDDSRITSIAATLDDARGLLAAFARTAVSGDAAGAGGLIRFGSLPSGQLLIKFPGTCSVWNNELPQLYAGQETRRRITCNGTALIRARVIDRSGAAVPGMEIFQHGVTRTATALNPPIDAPGRRGGRYTRAGSGGGRQFTTDATGSCEIPIPVGVRYQLSCSFDGAGEREYISCGPYASGEVTEIVFVMPGTATFATFEGLTLVNESPRQGVTTEGTCRCCSWG